MLNLVDISLMVPEKKLKMFKSLRPMTDERPMTYKKRRPTTEKKEKASTHDTDNFEIFCKIFVQKQPTM